MPSSSEAMTAPRSFSSPVAPSLALALSAKRPRETCGDVDVCCSSNKARRAFPTPGHEDLPPCTSTSADDATGQPSSQPWGCHATIGRRPYMEDSYGAGRLTNASTGEGWSSHYYCIFDGHGGSAVSDFLAANAGAYLDKALVARQAQAANANNGCSPRSRSGSDVATALRDAFLSLDQDIPTRANNDVGGSTAVCVVLNDHQLICGNCGDSRAVLSRSDGILALSDDHKPERPDEEARILKAGGRIINNGGARVMGMLSMTRAIGDTALQRFGVSPEPEVMIVDRSIHDEFMILASDGLWNSMSNEAAVNIVRRCLDRAVAQGINRVAATRIAAKVLVHAAMRLGSRDNITVMVVDVQSDRVPQTPSTPPQCSPVLSCIDRAASGAARHAPAAPASHSLVPVLQLPQLRKYAWCLSSGRELLSAENLLVHLPTPEVGSSSLPDRLWCSCVAVPNCCNGASSCMVEVPGVSRNLCRAT